MVNDNTKNSALAEIPRLKALVEETEVVLRAQRDVLKQRGFSLPPMAIQAMSSLIGELDLLQASIADDMTELGQLRFLADTSARINTTFDLNAVLIYSMDIVINLTGAERGFIILKNTVTGELQFKVVQENNVTKTFSPEEKQAPQISTTIVQDVLASGEVMLTDNAYRDDRFQSGVSIAQMTLRSVLCVPLRYRDNIVGVVYVDNRLKAGVFTEKEKMLLVAFANQISVAIENARLFNRIQTALTEITTMRQLMDNVFESINSGVITTDATSKIMMMNAASSDMLRAERTAAIGQPLNYVLPVGNELDSQIVNVLKLMTVHSLETQLDIKALGKRIFNIRLNPLKSTRDIAGGVALVLDDLTTSRARDEMINLTKRYLPPKMVENINTISQLAMGGERREVTCIYADVRDINSFPNARPQQIVEQVNTYLTHATNAIHQYEGVIDKYMGTIVMALFNTQLNPMEHDHAISAVMASLTMRDAMTEFYARLGISPNPHYYRIGINTGIATLGNVGSFNRREFTAIGDTINLAKRVEENTQLGQVIISESTYDHIQKYSRSFVGDIRFEEREAIVGKGRQQRTRVYEVFRA
ncbi:MAG: adenylate/guanylate cyclase domain-containing protein [Phototrophicales bacterium]|nr:adenylate/guanylate cyclase domain-containing protein [Phototrophicales bacterium]